MIFKSFFYNVILLITLAFQRIDLFLTLLFGLIFTGFITVLIRTFYFKPRPNKQQHVNYIDRIDASSFPSWHAARIFFIALILIKFFTTSYYNLFSIILLSIASLVSYSRIYLKKHDWTDILSGIILAIITLKIVIYLISFF